MRTSRLALSSPPAHFRPSLFFALLHQSENYPLPFQSSAHSLCVYPGWHQERFFQLFNLEPVNFLGPKSFRSNSCRRTPRRVSGFVLANPESTNDRNQPKSSARNSCRINTYRLRACNPFRRNTYKKPGRGLATERPANKAPSFQGGSAGTYLEATMARNSVSVSRRRFSMPSSFTAERMGARRSGGMARPSSLALRSMLSRPLFLPRTIWR